MSLIRFITEIPHVEDQHLAVIGFLIAFFHNRTLVKKSKCFFPEKSLEDALLLRILPFLALITPLTHTYFALFTCYFFSLSPLKIFHFHQVSLVNYFTIKETL